MRARELGDARVQMRNLRSRRSWPKDEFEEDPNGLLLKVHDDLDESYLGAERIYHHVRPFLEQRRKVVLEVRREIDDKYELAESLFMCMHGLPDNDRECPAEEGTFLERVSAQDQFTDALEDEIAFTYTQLLR